MPLNLKIKRMFASFNYKKSFFFTVIFSILLFSCGGASDDDLPVVVGLSNLVIEAEIQGVDSSNPYGDGTGIVNFTFSADNATHYKINFGNGEVIETSNNSLIYTFIGTPTAPGQFSLTDINKLKVKELKALCKSKGIKGYSKLKKQELLDLLL